MKRLKHIQDLVSTTMPHNTYLIQQLQLLENDLELTLKTKQNEYAIKINN